MDDDRPFPARGNRGDRMGAEVSQGKAAVDLVVVRQPRLIGRRGDERSVREPGIVPQRELERLLADNPHVTPGRGELETERPILVLVDAARHSSTAALSCTDSVTSSAGSRLTGASLSPIVSVACFAAAPEPPLDPPHAAAAAASGRTANARSMPVRSRERLGAWPPRILCHCRTSLDPQLVVLLIILRFRQPLGDALPMNGADSAGAARDAASPSRFLSAPRIVRCPSYASSRTAW